MPPNVRDANVVNKIVHVWKEEYDTALETLPSLFSMSIALIKYINIIYKTQKLIEIFKYMQNDNDRMMNFPEYDVLHKSLMQGRTVIVNITIYLGMSGIIYLMLPTITIIYNEMHAVNGTSKKEFLYQTEYNIDIDKYYFLITLHSYLASFVTLIIIGGLDTLYISLMHHGCALFTVTGFRFKTAHILNTDILKEGKDFGKLEYKDLTLEEQHQVYKKLILGIKEHQHVLEYTQLFQSLFSVALFMQMFMNIMTLSLSGVLILMKMGNFHDVLRVFVWLLGQLFHLFSLCLPGQNLVNSSEQLYYDLLESMWYTFFNKSNVLYQLAVMNTLTPCKLIAFKMVPLNMETYMSVTKTAVSYFTVLSSTR